MLRNVLLAQGVRGAVPPHILPGANRTRCQGRMRFVGDDPDAVMGRGLADPHAEGDS